MKIGILTFHAADNYGAVLQCYALQKYLSDLGHQVYVIDYIPKYIKKIYKPFQWHRHPWYFLKMLLRLPKSYLHHYYFKRFRHQWLNLKKINHNSIPMDFDIYIHGSDQIWNSKLTNGLDKIYLGDYKTKQGTKKICYAVSFENKPFKNDEKEMIKKSLTIMDGISLRENSLLAYLQPLTHKKIESVVDPTLLLSLSDWQCLTTNTSPKRKYVLVYMVGQNSKVIPFAQKIAKPIGAVVQVIDYPTSCHAHIYSVEGFINAFRHASYVVCTSFHATIFSIIFKRNFYTFASGSTSDIRYYALLKQLGLESRILTQPIEHITEIDYKGIDKKINCLSANSKKYLNLYIS